MRHGGGPWCPQAHSALRPPPHPPCHFPCQHLLPQEVPDDCFISQGVPPFSCPPSPSLLVEGDPQRALGGRAPWWLSPRIPLQACLCFVRTGKVASVEGRPAGRAIWLPALRTIKTSRSFGLIIPLLGIAAKGIIQKKKKGKKMHGLFIAKLFIIRRKWKQMPCPQIEKR